MAHRHKIFQKDYDKIKIDCHGGLTYSGELRNNDNKAMEEFALSLQACKIFTDSLENLAEFMRQHGYSEETEVYQFK